MHPTVNAATITARDPECRRQRLGSMRPTQIWPSQDSIYPYQFARKRFWFQSSAHVRQHDGSHTPAPHDVDGSRHVFVGQSLVKMESARLHYDLPGAAEAPQKLACMPFQAIVLQTRHG